MTRRNLLLGLVIALFLTGCVAPSAPMSQLQVRQIQTRVYDITDTKRAMKAILNVLQDEGFFPHEVDASLGFVHAVKDVDVEKPNEKFWATIFTKKKNERWRKNLRLDCAANVTETSEGMRIRVTFQAKVLNNRSEVVSVDTIQDPAHYQSFFSKVDKGIFIEKEGL